MNAEQWPVWSTTARVVVTEPDALPTARVLVESMLGEIDMACSRFRPDSELMAASRSTGPVQVSPLLATLIEVALKAAEESGGAVDPTVGSAPSQRPSTTTNPINPSGSTTGTACSPSDPDYVRLAQAVPRK